MKNRYREEPKKAVLVVTKNRLLGDVLVHLLGNEFALYPYPVTLNAFNRKSLLSFIELHQPAVVILEEDDTIKSFLLNHLPQYGRTRLILINSQSNQVHVQECFPITLTQSADFSSLLRSDFSPASLRP